MNSLLLIAWLVSTPTLTMTWTHSVPAAVGYHIIAEYDGGETECIAVIMDNKFEWRLKWKVPTRMFIVPVGRNDIVYREKQSLPSQWYVWGTLKLRIEYLYSEVRLHWSENAETVSIFSTSDFETWHDEGEVPPPANQFWDGISEEMKQKIYTIRNK